MTSSSENKAQQEKPIKPESHDIQTSIEVHSACYFGVNPNQVLAQVSVQGVFGGKPFGYFVSLNNPQDSLISKAVIDKIDRGEIVVSPTSADVESYKATTVRQRRDALLAETDYLVNADYPISVENRNELLIYRQALRDVTEQEGFPDNVTFPDKPSFLA